MKISQLYIYPVKSLRGVSVTGAEAHKNGLQYDRCFMLVKNEADKGMSHRSMHLVTFNEMVLFTTDLTFPRHEADGGTLTVTFNPPDDENGQRRIDVPLRPSVSELSDIEIDMYQSGTQAFNMGTEYNSWFSACFGYDVTFVYLGPRWRPVLMSTEIPPKSLPAATSWLSSITNNVRGVSSLLGYSSRTQEEEKLTFADFAPFLITTEESLSEVSARLEGTDAEMVKFRPNIVLSGASSAWEEDFWNEISISSTTSENVVNMTLPHNCCRCSSINIDYRTGKPGTGETGKVLKSMQRDRRVDPGMKYSPVFGRYGFLSVGSGRCIQVGDEVDVIGRNNERTIFDWPGVNTLAPAPT